MQSPRECTPKKIETTSDTDSTYQSIVSVVKTAYVKLKLRKRQLKGPSKFEDEKSLKEKEKN